MSIVVKREYGTRGNHDYLCAWDVLWGPVWCGRSSALTFPDMDSAGEAVRTAVACLQPVPWIVPDFGTASIITAVES